MNTELSKSISWENVRAKKMKKILIQYLQYFTDTKNKVYSGQKKLGNITILQGEVSHLYLRAPSIGLVPPLQQPGSQIENSTSKCFQLPAVFFLAHYSYRNLKIQKSICYTF